MVKTNKWFLKNAAFVVGGFGALSAPIALTVACGDSSAELVEANTSALANLKATDTSDNEIVTWNGPVIKDDSVLKYEYYAGTPKTEAELATLKPEDWSEFLPDKTSEDFNERDFWVRITPAAGFKVTKQYVNLAESSGLTKVRTRVYTDSISPTNLAIGSTVVYNPARQTRKFFLRLVPWADSKLSNGKDGLPRATIKFNVRNKSGLTADELADVLSKAQTMEELRPVEAYLAPIDESKYILLDRTYAEVKKMEIPFETATQTEATVTAAQISWLEKLVAGSTSTHNNVVWTTIQGTPPSDETTVGFFQYLTGDYQTISDVEAAPLGKWVGRPPVKIDYDHAKRRVWAKALYYKGIDYINPYYEFTTTSQIKNVVSVVDVAKKLDDIDLSKIILSGSQLDLKVNESAFSAQLNPELKVLYSFNNKTNLSFEELKAAVANATNDLQIDKVKAIKAHLAVIDPVHYRVTDTREATVTVDSAFTVEKALILAADGEIGSLFQLDQVNTKHSESVAWNAYTLPSYTNAANVSFLLGEYLTPEAASAATGWTSALPTMGLDFDQTKRHLWVHVKTIDGTKIVNPYLEITFSTGLQNVKSLVDSSAAYKMLDLGRVMLSGTQEQPVLSESSVTLPAGTKLVYTFNNKTNLSSSDFLRVELVNRAENPTLAKAQATRIALAVTDPAKYVIANDMARTLVTNGNGVAANTFYWRMDMPASVKARAIAKVNDTNTHNNVSWTVTETTEVEKVEYIVGEYQTAAEAQAKISERKPIEQITSVNYDPSKRRLWAYVTPKAGFLIRDAARPSDPAATNNWVEVTDLSQIGAVKGLVDVSDEYKTLDMTKARVVKTQEDPDVLETDLTLPGGTAVRYTLNGTSNLTKDALIQAIKDQNMAGTLTLAHVQGITATLVVSDPNRFVIHAPKTGQAATWGSADGTKNFYWVLPVPEAAYTLLTAVVDDVHTHENVAWNVTPIPADSKIKTVYYAFSDASQYFQDVYANKIAGKTATEFAASTKVVDYNHDSRQLIAFVKAVDHYTFRYQGVIPVIYTSRVYNVKSRVELAPGFATINLGVQKLTGTVASRTAIRDQGGLNDSGINYNMTLPAGARLAILDSDNTEWTGIKRSISNSVEVYIYNALSASATTTQRDKDYINNILNNRLFVGLAVTDSSKYVLGDKTKVVKIDTSAVVRP